MSLRSGLFCILAMLASLASSLSAPQTGGGAPAPSAASSSKVNAASLQKKAIKAQAQIRANQDDRDQLVRAVKINEVPLVKAVLLKNGFTGEDLQDAKITLRTGEGKGGGDEIEISATCCDPKEIMVQRSLPYLTK